MDGCTLHAHMTYLSQVLLLFLLLSWRLKREIVILEKVVLFDGDVIKAANTEAIKTIRFLLEEFLHESNGG